MSKKHINATHYEEIPPFPVGRAKSEHVVHAIIETSKHSPHKYALKRDYGIIAFEEILPGEMSWPYDYGFVPQTLAPDGDPLDILVLSDKGFFSGCLLEARVLGSVRERKNGVENDRLIAAPRPSAGAPRQADFFRDISDVPQVLIDEIVAFLDRVPGRGVRAGYHGVAFSS